MSVQLYSDPDQTEGRRKAFLEQKSINLSYKLSLTWGDFLTIIKVFIILLLLVGIGNILAIFKINQQVLLSIDCLVSRYILLLSKLKQRRRLFLKGERREATLRDYPQGHLIVIRDERVSPFVKFEIV